jgi:uncharacterized protein YndB with AHSA1/START domain
MSLVDVPASVRGSIIVEASLERAFEIFTAGIGSWWPRDRHVLAAEVAEMVFEPWVGGNIVDRGIDGSECRWSRILVYEPPRRIVFSWDVNINWQPEPDPKRTSEVEVRFIEEAPSRTRVELEHRHLDRHGEGWERMQAAVGSAEGWTYGLNAFARRAANAEGGWTCTQC